MVVEMAAGDEVVVEMEEGVMEVAMAVGVTAVEEQAAVGVGVTAEGSGEVEKAAAARVAEGKAEVGMARGVAVLAAASP